MLEQLATWNHQWVHTQQPQGKPSLSSPLTNLQHGSPVGWAPSGYTHSTVGEQNKEASSPHRTLQKLWGRVLHTIHAQH